MKDLFKTGQVLGRLEMKKIMAGSGGCSSCSGCQEDNSSHGPCVKWECRYGSWCVPVTSDCCIYV